MKAFIGLTSDDWFDFHESKNHKQVVFWTNRLINLQKGAKFLFLCGVGQKDRYIAGYAKVLDQGTVTVKELWDQFGDLTGAESLEDLSQEISRETTKKIIVYEDNVSFWLLEEFTPFRELVYAEVEGFERNKEDVFLNNIRFPRNLQVGKLIEESQANDIIKAGF